MGFEDRDYSQSDESWKSSGATDTPVTKWFVILTVVTFVIQLFTGSSVMYELLSLKSHAVLEGQVWRLFTFAICHNPVDILRLIVSMLIIWRFGTELERMYGSHELFMIYVSMIAFVGVSFSVWGLIFSLSSPLHGGSYSVALGLLALFATHFPRMEVCILPLISIQLRWLVALYALFGVYPALHIFQAGGGPIGFAYASEVLSIVFALAYRRFDWHLSAFIRNFDPSAWKRAWRNRMARGRLRVYKPSVEIPDLESKVDDLLAKIHEHGSESLTDEERAILVKASERIKNRS